MIVRAWCTENVSHDALEQGDSTFWWEGPGRKETISSSQKRISRKESTPALDPAPAPVRGKNRDGA